MSDDVKKEADSDIVFDRSHGEIDESVLENIDTSQKNEKLKWAKQNLTGMIFKIFHHLNLYLVT